MKFLKHLEHSFIGIAKEFRLSYMPPLMVYLAAGISGLTSIVGAFFVKEHLGLSAEFLAGLAFWAGVPWILKMPLGHMVDVMWRHKSVFIYIGASLLAASMIIMIGLVGHKNLMETYMSLEAWFVLAVLLAPIGYVIQDIVADAMTVEAVPIVDETGAPYDSKKILAMHITMQVLGRAAIVGGSIGIALVNMYMFADISPETTPPEIINDVYSSIYQMALIIPLISVLGVFLAFVLRIRRKKAMQAQGLSNERIDELLYPQGDKASPNWWILGGSAVYVVFTIAMGLSDIELAQEIIFVGSMAIIMFVMYRLMQFLPQDQQVSLIAISTIIFIYRAIPGPGAGAGWWKIDVLGFDQAFFALLGLIGGVLALVGMLLLRKWMADKSIAYIIVFLTVIGAILSLPEIGMFYGLHEWTSSITSGVVDARFIAIIDRAAGAPFGQVAMIPMLAWIAHSAPRHLKATFFAVMASFTNLALSADALGEKYLNKYFIVTREVKDRVTGEITTYADYSELGTILIIVLILSVALPLLTIAFFKYLEQIKKFALYLLNVLRAFTGKLT